MSMDKLIEKIAETQNPTVVGLDPKLEYIPEFIKEQAFIENGENLKAASKAIFAFNKGIIDAICDIVPAIKPYLLLYGSTLKTAPFLFSTEMFIPHF